MKKFAAIAVATLAVLSLTGCFGNEGKSETPATKDATNVEIVKVPGSVGFSDGVIVFDVERDGQILTCMTKQNYNSGVGCVKKEA